MRQTVPSQRRVAPRPSGTALRLLGALLLALAACAGARAAGGPNPTAAADAPAAFDVRVDALVGDGFERPARALAALQALQRGAGASLDERRVVLQAIGSVEARSGATQRADAIAEQLLALVPQDASGRVDAAANLVRAEVAETAGQIGVAGALAQTALPAFQTGCAQAAAQATSASASTPASTASAPTASASASAAESAPASSSTCDYRSVWRALQILERRALSQGLPAAAAVHARAALALVERSGDASRQATNLGALALYAQGRGEPEAAQRLLARAVHAASQTHDLAQRARMSNVRATLASMRDDHPAALRELEAARSQAAQANAPRLEAQMLNNLSDEYARLGRPADALRAADRALRIVRRYHDLRAERVLIGNAGIAKIGLGRIAEGKQDMARVLDLWQQGGESGRQVDTLREFGAALAAAGDARDALELYHRERTLSDALMRANRSAALQELRTRNDAVARQREIELLGRDNALKTAALANRALLQRIGWLLAAVMLLAIALATLLYRRVRETNQKLAASHVQLQAQSERDPLTNLANRRHFQSVMTRLCSSGGFEGALLLVDLDHFKHVNDVHGHAAGDQVLVEVAHRLNDAVRADDLVVRWGGEEFLILAPRAGREQAEQMATRVLRVVGGTPIEVGTQRLRVTASIGYARFPLPPHSAAVPWEQAVNLADMALYTAKNQGRNRAVGITATSAATPEALRAVEADFDRAWHQGRVTLLQTPGPAADDDALAA
jgi:diguanylate cyclase (GGDEF)-like protein